MASFNFKVLFTLILAALAAIVSSPARAEGQSITVASRYFFTDFNAGSNEPVFNYSSNFRAPLGITGNWWMQYGSEAISREIDLTGSKRLGPCTVMAGVYYTPDLDNFTIPTARFGCATNLAGINVGADTQWYGGDLDDESRIGVSASHTFELTGPADLDFGFKTSWFHSGPTTHAIEIGVPVGIGDDTTIRPYMQYGWGTGEDNFAAGFTVNW